MKLKIIALIILSLQIFTFANEDLNRNIVVYGDGKLQVKPDIAIVDFVISSKANTSQKAKTLNDKLSNKVKNILDKEDIQKQDIKIKNNTISTRNTYTSDGKIEKTFYVSSKNVEIKLTDISKESEFLDALTKIGIQDIDITYQKSNIAQQLDLAMKEAVNSAISKAKNITKNAGISLGDILEIQEIQTNPMYETYRLATFSNAKQNLNADSGIIDIDAKVKIKFAIK